MKKILIFIMSIVMLTMFEINVFSEVKQSNFSYYVVPNVVYDNFLTNVNDIEYLVENSRLEFPEDEGFIRFDVCNDGSFVNDNIISYLSDYNNVCQVLKDAGLSSEIYDYAFFSAKYIGNFSMPLSLWVNTQEGIKFAIIYRTGSISKIEPNLFGLFKVEILSAEEYIKRCSERNAKVFFNGKEKEIAHAKIRYEGVEIGIRELMESVGVKVTWNETDRSLTLTSENFKGKYDFEESGGFKFELNNYNTDLNAYYINVSIIPSGNDITEALYTKQIILMCRFVNDRIVISSNIANFLLYNLLNTENYKAITIDSDKNIININY